jgi:hypothetical protein
VDNDTIFWGSGLLIGLLAGVIITAFIITGLETVETTKALEFPSKIQCEELLQESQRISNQAIRKGELCVDMALIIIDERDACLKELDNCDFPYDFNYIIWEDWNAV